MNIWECKIYGWGEFWPHNITQKINSPDNMYKIVRNESGKNLGECVKGTADY